MKAIILFFIGAFLIAAAGDLYAQNREITFILLRHAEKDASPLANKADLDLSAEGRLRAARLVDVLRNYKPEQFFSTIFRRTRDTAAPSAENLEPNYRLMIQNYDYAEIEEFAERLLKLNARTVVVVGHTTTTPKLANLLIKQEKYKALAESEYDKIWIIKIRRNKGKPNKIIEEKVISY